MAANPLSVLSRRANLAPRSFGTKARSFIKIVNEAGIEAIVGQQFEIANEILVAGLVPIIEPEIDIRSSEKAEAILRANIVARLGELRSGHDVILKLSLPEVADFYTEFVSHPNVLRVVALSGGYTSKEADVRLAANHGVIASFSRGLTEGLSVHQSDEEVDAALKRSIESIFQASVT